MSFLSPSSQEVCRLSAGIYRAYRWEGSFVFRPAELLAQEAQLALDDNGDKCQSAHFGVHLVIGDSVSALEVKHETVT